MVRVRGLAILIVAAGVLGGCPETQEDILTQGNLALWRKDADGAIAQFEKALAMDPQSVDAYRGMANAHDEKGEAAKQEEWLRKGWKLEGITDQDKRFFQQSLEKMLIARAEKASAPEEKAAAFKAAIEVRSDSKANGFLAQHWLQRGGELAEAGKLQEAADLLSGVLDLRVSSTTKKNAMTQEVTHRLALFRQGFDKEFPAKHQQALVQEGAYDGAAKRFKVAAQADVPPNVSPTDPDLTRRAADAAAAMAYKNLLGRLAKLAGKALPDPAPKLSFRTWQADSEGWVRRPTTYRYAASISYDEAAQGVFMIQAHERIEASRAKIEGPDKDKPKPPKANEGSKGEGAGGEKGATGAVKEAPAAKPAEGGKTP